MEFRVLGPIEVRSNGDALPLGGPKQRAILACLILQANHLVSAEALIDALWGDEPPDTARNTLQGYVSRLRRAIGDSRLEGRAPGYVLHAEPEEVDALRFESLVRSAREILREDPERASALLSEALAMWRGPALADVAEDPSVSGEAVRLEESRLMALEDRIEADLERGMHAQLVGELEALTTQHPLREGPWAQLMLALYRGGRQADSLRCFQRLRDHLVDELGLDPSPRLARLQELVLVHDPSLVLEADAEVSQAIHNPFKGLRPFAEEDAADFYGREELVRTLVTALEDGARFLALVGPSGSGKSSVVSAGVVPALRNQWAIARMVPGRRPFDELLAALASPDEAGEGALVLPGSTESLHSIEAPDDRRLLLVVDQFEELFSVSDESDRTAFLDMLATTVGDGLGRVSVGVTLRGDFYDRPLLHPRFAALFADGVVNVTPMSAGEIEEAVVGPARGVGSDVEPPLLAQVVADATDQPGALPLLQYAMTELFDQRTGSTLKLADYRALGGVDGALSRRAEELYARLDDAQRRVALQVFLRLVRLGDSMADASRRVPIGELTALNLDPVVLSEVLESFGRHRLLSFDRDPVSGDATVQVAHEALLSKWDRLAGWIDQHRADLARHDSLSHAMHEWEAASRDPDYLLTGNRLAESERWSTASTFQLTQTEKDYRDAASERRRNQEAAESERAARQGRLERSARMRLVALVVAIALVLTAATVGTLTWWGARPPDVALVFSGAGDGGFNDIIANGFDRAASEIGVRSEKVTTPEEQILSQVRRLSEDGVELIVMPAGDCGLTLKPVAVSHPDTRYVALDCLGHMPGNVAQVWFASEEGSFLAGAAAALKSKTGTVGFIGGLDFPLIWAFGAGFEAGARYIDPSIDVRSTYLSQYPDYSGFTSPSLAARSAAQLYRNGADVIYHAAGYAGLGVFEAAVAESKALGRHLWAIGVDTDQYRAVMGVNPDFEPGSWQRHILTSMVKRYANVTYANVEEYSQGRFFPGLTVFGLAEGGVDIVYTGGFIDEFRPIIEELRRQIIAGEIDVPTVPSDKRIEASDWPPELIPP